ncbi:glycosyltransferase [Paenibacillus sp. SC116]|uniref:glycosyltransferase n=1 Tax=Paenibacillus sp. SC116 TaxID=2968986 RepID=UPI00215A72AE|nr:glycosyltransferase [Paenibacillus sp. SC116]MCR8844173.1 glycosyltransferase [Paenibacillus sp. SC116]
MIGETRKKLRVAMLITSLAGGGAEKAVSMLLQGFNPERYELHLIVNWKEGPYMSLLPSYVQVSEMNAPRLRSAWKAYIRVLRQVRPDVVISHMWENNVLNVVGRRLSGLRFATVLCEHSSISRHRGKGVNMMRRWCYKRADAVVGCSHMMGEELKYILQVPRSLVHVIYNAVLNDSFYRRANENYEHHWLQQGLVEARTRNVSEIIEDAANTDGNQEVEATRIPVLLGLGRLSPEKRYDLLIEAVYLLHQRGYKVRALIIGEGAERERLTKLIADRDVRSWVELPGYASNPLPILRQADIYVQSSDVEGLPTALIEAVALGTSIVATRTATGTEEVLEGIHSALLVPCGDVEGMADALEKHLVKLTAQRQHEEVPSVWSQQYAGNFIEPESSREIAVSHADSIDTQFQRLNKFTLSYVVEQYEALICDVLKKHGIEETPLPDNFSPTEAISQEDGTVRKGVSR